MTKIFFSILAVLLTSCVHVQFNPEYDLKKEMEREQVIVKTRHIIYLSAYVFEGTKHKAQWHWCEVTPGQSVKAKNEVFVLFHPESKAFDQPNFCYEPLAQAFLAQGYHVAAINRPGYGKSTGDQAMFHPQTEAAVEAALDIIKRSHQQQGAFIRGFWGYSVGASEALFVGKQEGFQDIWIFAGGGLYDLLQVKEQTQSQDISNLLSKLEGREDEALEINSISFDFEAIPGKNLFIYHGQLDKAVPHKQAEDFANALRTSEKNVHFRSIDQLSHLVSLKEHGIIIRMIFKELEAKAQSKKKAKS